MRKHQNNYTNRHTGHVLGVNTAPNPTLNIPECRENAGRQTQELQYDLHLHRHLHLDRHQVMPNLNRNPSQHLVFDSFKL